MTVNPHDSYTGVLSSVDSYNTSLSIKIPLKEFELLVDEKGNRIVFPDPRYSSELDPYKYKLPLDVLVADFNAEKTEHINIAVSYTHLTLPTKA